MLITPDVLDHRYTQTQVDAIINALMMDVYEFSRIACLDGFAYGVRNLCDTCAIKFNWCLRRSLINQLVEAHQYVQEKLKYKIVGGYFTQKLEWCGQTRFQLENPGIAELLVKETVTKVPAVTGTVDPYIYATTVVAGGYVLIPVELIDDPESVIYRNGSDARLFIDDSNPITRVATDWKVYLTGVTTGEDINIQSCKYMIVDVDLSSVVSGEVLPVYTDTVQRIPMVKPSEDIGGGLTRFWFSPFVLTDHAFRERGVNLLNGEFYKLVQTIEFVNVVESAQAVVVEYYNCPSNNCPTTTSSDTDEITIEIIDASRGIIAVNACEFEDCDCKQIVSVTVAYRTDPELVNPGSQSAIKDAISHLVAAELPLVACGCIERPDQSRMQREFNYGFIGAAQQAYTEIRVNPITGENIENWKHGNLYGQVKFVEKMARVKKFKRTVKR